MTSGSFKNVIYKMCLEIKYSIHMRKKDLTLNDRQRLICHKTKSNQTITVSIFGNNAESYHLTLPSTDSSQPVSCSQKFPNSNWVFFFCFFLGTVKCHNDSDQGSKGRDATGIFVCPQIHL